MDVTGDSGVLKRVLRAAPEGAKQPDALLLCCVEGAPFSAAVYHARSSYRTAVSYEGRLADGTVFDRWRLHRVHSLPSGALTHSLACAPSCDDGTTFGFQVGAGKVIRGWDVGVATMRVGERAELVCRADYAYGDAGSPPDIPPGATLTFDVELLEVKPPRSAAGAGKVDVASELARLTLQREERAASAAAAAEERKTSAQKREEAKAAAAARLANKGQKKGGKTK
jgi:peptidylprolyl isomerase